MSSIGLTSLSSTPTPAHGGRIRNVMQYIAQGGSLDEIGTLTDLDRRPLRGPPERCPDHVVQVGRTALQDLVAANSCTAELSSSD